FNSFKVVDTPASIEKKEEVEKVEATENVEKEEKVEKPAEEVEVPENVEKTETVETSQVKEGEEEEETSPIQSFSSYFVEKGLFVSKKSTEYDASGVGLEDLINDTLEAR